MIDQSGSSGSNNAQLCGICGGDGRISNSFGLIAKCPSCHGSGRRSEDTGFHDVTKTKTSHRQQSNRAPVVEKQTWPASPAGAALATEIRDSSALSSDLKTRLTREIIDHEVKHGTCTQTFLKKVRKQVRPVAK